MYTTKRELLDKYNYLIGKKFRSNSSIFIVTGLWICDVGLCVGCGFPWLVTVETLLEEFEEVIEES